VDERYQKVFKPGTYPELTYVVRQSMGTKYTYEERLQQSLKIDGYLTYIVGPSKTGKTVLCERVIGRERMVSMTGNDFARTFDFWEMLGKKAGLSMNAEVSEQQSDLSKEEQKSTTIKKKYKGNKDRVIEYFKANNKVFVLDDFHYASPDIQYDIACQLKEVIRLGFKAIVISLPHRSDDAIRLNPDLTGRISVIEIKSWEQKQLEEIARKGFKELNVFVDDTLISRIAMESIHSPQLMQAICLNIGLLPADHEVITDEVVEESCRFTCINLPYGDVVRILKAGPPTRGQKRLQYQLKDHTYKDIYSFILKILADNPPLVEIDLEEVMKRIQNNVVDGRIAKERVKDALKKWQDILDHSGPLYQVFEWKDDILHIQDNLFLFYIRWTFSSEVL